MAFRKKTLRDLEVAEGQTVLVRADLNVPLDGGEVADDTRIRAALPAIEELRSRGAKIVVASHLGRPKGQDPDTSLEPVSKRLGERLGTRVFQAPEVVGPEVRRGAARLDEGEILALENTRWDSGETKNDPQLAQDLADLADHFVLDAFGSAHRAHASTVGVAEHLPSAAGPLLEREVTTLEGLVEDPERRLTVVLGGAKVTDKIALIDRFLDLADQLLIGGAMSFSFFRAQGHETGNSLIDDDSVQSALSALEKADSARATLILPVDLVIADRFAADAKTRERAGVDVPD